jgi:hypothetical protein
MNADDDGCGDGLGAPPANPAEISRRADATALDDVDDLDDGDGWAPLVEGQPPSRAGIGPEDPKAKKRTLYSGPEEFMNQYLRFLVRRRLGGSHTWCSQWWAHPDAVLHITALWDTWEHYRREGDALSTSTWLLQRLGPHLTVLMSKDTGPFAACRPDRHCDIDPLPTSPAPPGTWAAAAFSDPD